MQAANESYALKMNIIVILSTFYLCIQWKTNAVFGPLRTLLEVSGGFAELKRLIHMHPALRGGGGGGNFHRLGYGMCHFLRVLFWLKNKFLGLFYSL